MHNMKHTTTNLEVIINTNATLYRPSNQNDRLNICNRVNDFIGNHAQQKSNIWYAENANMRLCVLEKVLVLVESFCLGGSRTRRLGVYMLTNAIYRGLNAPHLISQTHAQKRTELINFSTAFSSRSQSIYPV